MSHNADRRAQEHFHRQEIIRVQRAIEIKADNRAPIRLQRLRRSEHQSLRKWQSDTRRQSADRKFGVEFYR